MYGRSAARFWRVPSNRAVARIRIHLLRHGPGARLAARDPRGRKSESAILDKAAFGDSRGHWEGNTLVVDVTNFSPKFSYRGAREKMHLVERWTRLDRTTIEYSVTIDDPTTWIRPWTVKQELIHQDEQANRIYY